MSKERGELVEKKHYEPKYQWTARLPVWNVEGKKVLMNAHTDVLLELLYFLSSLPKEKQQKLLIKGRVLTNAQFDALDDHPVFQFYLEKRQGRVIREKDRLYPEISVPNSLEFSDKEIQQLAKTDFTVETLSEEIGFSTGWYPASQIIDTVNHTPFGVNVILPNFGAVSEFTFGSETISTHMLFAYAKQFEQSILGRSYGAQERHNLPLHKALLAAARIVRLID